MALLLRPTGLRSRHKVLGKLPTLLLISLKYLFNEFFKCADFLWLHRPKSRFPQKALGQEWHPARGSDENQDRRKQRERRILTDETPAFAELRRGRRQIRERG
jgi:hypothetical protein